MPTESKNKDIVSQIKWLTSEAVIKQKEGNIEEAISCYLNVIDLDDQQPAWLYEEAIMLLSSANNVEQSLAIGEKALKIHPQSSKISQIIENINQSSEPGGSPAQNQNLAQTIDYLHTEAVAKHKDGKLEEAITFYLQSIEVDENQPAWIYGNVITLLVQVGRLDEGLALGEKAERLHPDSDVIYRAIGIGFHHKNIISATIDKYYKALEINGDQPTWVYVTLLKLLVDNQKFIDIFNVLQKALKTDISLSDICKYTGLSLQLINNLNYNLENQNLAGFYEEEIIFLSSKSLWNECIEVCNLLLEINPQSTWTYNHMAIALSKLNSWDESYDCYQKINKIQPDFWQEKHLSYLSYHNYGDTLLVHQKWEEAYEFYSRAIELNTSFFWSYINLGKVLIKLERWEEAEESLLQAIELNPFHAEALLYLGEVCENRNRIEAAKKYYLQSQKIDPDNLSIQYNLERISRKEENHKESQNDYDAYCDQAKKHKDDGNNQLAIESYQQAIDINPSFFFAYLKLADILFFEGNFDQARKYYETAKDFNPNEVWIHNNLGECLVYLNRHEEAIESYQQAINLDNSFCLSYVRCGEAYEKIGKADDAIVRYKQALDVDPNFVLAKNNLESILSKQTSKSHTIQEKAVEDSITDSKHYFGLGQESQHKGDLENAAFYYNKAIEINSSFSDSYLKLADILVLKGSLDEAIENYQKVIELEPTQVWAYNNMAEALGHKGKLDESIELYKKANQINPDFSLSYFRLAEILERLGELDEAIRAYEKVLDIDQNFFDTKNRLQALISKKEQQQAMEIAYRRALEDLDSPVFGKEQFYILDAHADDPSGLGIVARRCSHLGKIVKNSRGVVGKVLVPGRPDEYMKMVRPENINYIWTTFESSRIPEIWVNAINDYFDEVFVPHSYILETFKQSGVKKPMTVLPQGYPERYRTKALNKQPDKLIIGIIGCPTARKNFVNLIEAVVQLRNEGHDVELKIHCPWLVHHTQRAWGDVPGITLSEGKLSDDKINEWFSELDAYIYPSSGEGWSFTPRESMSLAIPTIISDISVHKELADSGYYLTIESDEWQPAYYEFLQDSCGEWKVYPTNIIKESILEMARNYDYWQKQAEKGQKWVKQHCAWEPIEKQIMSEIFPQHIMFCSTKDIDCGIHTYSLDLVSSLPETKYVGSYEHIQSLLQRENIKLIHVQQEHGITDNAELKFHSQHWNCKKQITLHSVIRGDNNPIFAEAVANFDDVFVLTQDAQSEIVSSRYVPHGADIPIEEELLLERVDPPIAASFGFIHEKKGYQYIAEATRQLEMPWRIVGKLNIEHKTRIHTWENNIQKFDHIQHFNGFFPENKVFQLLSEASVLIFLYENDDYLYQSGAVLKAARCQRPIICSTATPMKQLQGCVHYVPYGDVEALKEGIKIILQNQAYGKILVNTMNTYLQENTWDKIATKLYQS